MATAYPAEEFGVIELAYCPDIFVSGVAPVEQRRDFVRLTLYSERRTDVDGFETEKVERIVVARVVFTRDGFQRAIRGLTASMQECAIGCISLRMAN